MNLFVGVTDGDWYELLASQPALDEVNFWQPGGNTQFKALASGELFLFKLHSPLNFIVGGGVFAHASLLPASLAWESFGIANGATTIVEMRARIEKYRKQRPARTRITASAASSSRSPSSSRAIAGSPFPRVGTRTSSRQDVLA